MINTHALAEKIYMTIYHQLADVDALDIADKDTEQYLKKTGINTIKRILDRVFK